MSFKKPWEVWNPLWNCPTPCGFVCDGMEGEVRLVPSLIPLFLSQVISHLSRHVMLSNQVVKRRNALWVFLRNMGFVPRSVRDSPQDLLLFLSFAHVCTAPLWRRMNWLRFNPKHHCYGKSEEWDIILKCIIMLIMFNHLINSSIKFSYFWARDIWKIYIFRSDINAIQ